MKKLFFAYILPVMLLTMMSLPVKANINGAGYYRVKNYGTDRWGTLIDNQATVDKISASADLHSLELTKDTEAILSDPGSVIYLTPKGNNKYDFAAQGTSLESLIDYAVNIRKYSEVEGQDLYRIWGTTNGVTKYILDGQTDLEEEYGKATISSNISSTGSYQNIFNWLFEPVNVEGSNYFGAVPEVVAEGLSYTTLFTSFAYKPYSQGVKAYYIGRVGFGMAEMIEITDAVPAGSPVVIQCAGMNSGDNRLQLMSEQAALPSNALSGVYFNYSSSSRKNQVAYDPSTMRVLGLCSDGSLGFVVAKNLDFIPANTAYLRVPAGSVSEFRCVSSTEYEANVPEAPEQIYCSDGTILLPQDDYTYTGTLNIAATDLLELNFSTEANGSEETVIGAVSASGANVKINLPASYPFEYGSDVEWVMPNWPGGNLYVTLNIRYENVMFSADFTGIDSIEDNGTDLHYQGGIVSTEGGKLIKVIDMTGKIVAQGKGKVDLTLLPKGMYIAMSGSKVIKVMN